MSRAGFRQVGRWVGGCVCVCVCLYVCVCLNPFLPGNEGNGSGSLDAKNACRQAKLAKTSGLVLSDVQRPTL